VISGLGFFEILIVLLIVLMFFGSKELPRFIRETGRFLAKVRRYSDKVRRELNDATRITDFDESDYDEVGEKKKKLRTICLDKRKELTDKQRKEYSARIVEQFLDTEEFSSATAVMMYAATKTEVQTRECVETILTQGKRVIMPYCFPNSTEMGIAEIKDYSKDLTSGQYNILEPLNELRDNFLKSDIRLVVCPGVGFDKNGARLGRGKGCYDYFLKELKSKITLVGFAFQCQILEEPLPFDYHDIPVDLLITEKGIQFRQKISLEPHS
jgi:5-formyltetrahydrofolate cyclo-ligase